jgi:hypothetical protein
MFINGFIGKIFLYQMNYEKIKKLDDALSFPSDSTLGIGVVDDLLVIHSKNQYMTFTFDIK